MPRPINVEHKLDLGPLPPSNFAQARSAGGSPDYSGNSPRYQLGSAMATVGSAPSGSRTVTGSPSKEYSGSRLFPKRAREIQAQAGLTPQVWRPPPTGSGHSTPLRETIPESPTNHEFPDFNGVTNNSSVVTPPLTSSGSLPAPRRGRADTAPSRWSPQSATDSSFSQASLPPLGSQPLSAQLPLESSSLQHQLGAGLSSATTSSLLSRLRAGSLPQRAALVTNLNHIGPSYLNNPAWPPVRSRANTLQGAQSAGLPSSTGQFPRDSFADGDVKTLDYLGLAEKSPIPLQDPKSAPAPGNPLVAQLAALNDLKRNANRLRSYSVNAKERYDDFDGEDQLVVGQAGSVYAASGSQYPDASAVQEAVRQHNLDVQLFTQLANANRPRARTAGMLEAPSARSLRNYLPTPSRLDNSMSADEIQNPIGGDGLTNAMRGMQVDDSGDGVINEMPSRSLWLGNIPPSTAVSSLNAIFDGFGPIESTRVLTHKSCGFVNFENIESAVIAKAQLHNSELFPGAGSIRIGFAKAPSGDATPRTGPGNSPDPNTLDKSTQAATIKPNANINGDTAAAALKTPKIRDLRPEIEKIVVDLGASAPELAKIKSNIEQALAYDLYHTDPPMPTEPSPHRQHDAPKLRDIRKRIDSGGCTQEVIESMAREMLLEIAELSSDYLGNTVVQKLFEICSEETKEAMLEAIAPRLAEIGMHKNGTWAAQKIIDVAHTPAQMNMIVNALRPHAIPLFHDQYGNYVIQCCLRFGTPYNDYIFDVMLQRLWAIAQGRFGARAMRACLESHWASREQQRMLAAAVTLHSVQLATNANGALLLTWFLDTCTFPNRRAVLAPRLVTHLVHLCTHKVAYLTVLKVINQRNEPEPRDLILRTLFASPDNDVLKDILSDQTCGATFVYKVLSTPFLNEKMRPEAIETVRSMLTRLGAQPNQGYKRLMDEVGLSTRQGGGTPSREQSSNRSVSRSRGANTFQAKFDQQQQQGYADYQYAGTLPLQQQQTDRSGSFDSTVMDPYLAASVTGTPTYTHSPSIPGLPPLTPQQMQYQQAILAQQQAAANAQRANAYLNSPMVGYRNATPTMDVFGRPASMSGSPGSGAHMGTAGPQSFAQPAYSPLMAMSGYQYPASYFPQQQQQASPHGQIGGQRRGRANNAARS